MLCLDLIIVSLIATFMICLGEPEVILPLVVIRLWLSFSVHYRKKSAGWMIGVFLCYASVLMLNCSPESVFILPVARLYDYACMALTGDSTMLEGAFRSLLPAPKVNIPCAWLWWIVLVALALWFFFYPIAIYLSDKYLKKNLVSDCMPWKKVIAFGFAYAVAYYAADLYGALRLSMDVSPTIFWIAVTCIALIPFVPYFSGRLRPAVRWYLASIVVALPAVVSGYFMIDKFGIVVMVACSIGLFMLFGKKGRLPKPAFSSSCIYVGIAAVLFWAAQYGLGVMHVCLLAGSLALFFFVAFTNVRLFGGKRYAWAYFILAAFVLPSVALGYNPFRCITCSRYSNCTVYLNSPRGLMYVYSPNRHFCIRDRFGMIMPPEYDMIKTIGNNEFPFFLVRSNGAYGVYDLVRQELAIPVKYGSIEPYTEYQWTFDALDGDYSDYISVADYYSPFDPSSWPTVYDYDFQHPLDEYMVLKYNCRITVAEAADEVLCKLMIPVITHDADSVDDADFKWQWAHELMCTIDSINDCDLAFGEGDVYGDAIQIACDYVDESGIGSQAEMNCYSYVLAVAEEFKALVSNIEVANFLPNLDVKKEFALFDNYIQTLHKIDNRLDLAYERYYSMRPMEVNHQRLTHFRQRLSDLDQLIDAHNETLNDPIPNIPAVSDAQIRKHFKDLKDQLLPVLYSADYDKPTIVDTLCNNFSDWLNYREVLRKKMPAPLAKVYKIQTDQIRYNLINPPVYDEDDDAW